MGRAIDMENDIAILKQQVTKLEDIVRGMTHSMDEMSEKAVTTKHIDLVDDVKTEEKKDGKKKANDKGTGKDSATADKSDGDSKVKDNKSGNDSK